MWCFSLLLLYYTIETEISNTSAVFILFPCSCVWSQHWFWQVCTDTHTKGTTGVSMVVNQLQVSTSCVKITPKLHLTKKNSWSWRCFYIVLTVSLFLSPPSDSCRRMWFVLIVLVGYLSSHLFTIHKKLNICQVTAFNN